MGWTINSDQEMTAVTTRQCNSSECGSTLRMYEYSCRARRPYNAVRLQVQQLICVICAQGNFHVSESLELIAVTILSCDESPRGYADVDVLHSGESDTQPNQNYHATSFLCPLAHTAARIALRAIVPLHCAAAMQAQPPVLVQGRRPLRWHVCLKVGLR